MAHIVFLTDQVYQIGGITNLIHLKANYWAKKNIHRVTIVTTEQKDQAPFYSLHEDIDLYDLKIDYDRGKSYFGSANFTRVISNIFRLRKLLRKIKPDIIIVANHIPVTFFFPLLQVSAKFVKEFHFSKYYRSAQKQTIFKKIEAFLEAKYDHLVVLNKEEKDFYHTSNVVHISNPIRLSGKQVPDQIERRKVAIAAGRISEVKRFDVLIEIWNKFSKLNKDWKLEIYGDGKESYVEGLKKRINDLGIGSRVEIKSSTDDLKTVMETSGLYLMTSAQECFPMVLLEAQSCGLPIIAYDCPTGPRNIITNNQDGVLVEFDKEEAFIQELLRLSADDNCRQRLSENGYQNVKKYTLNRIMSEWEEKIIKS